MISLIAALNRNHVIGRDNALPWHAPADLRHFRQVTMGKPMIMGRRNHESIGRALPGRKNIVLTRDPLYVADGCQVANSVDQALALAEGADEVMIIGGAEIYALFMPRVDRMYLTWVDNNEAGDTHFPPFDATAWSVIDERQVPANADSPFALTFQTLEAIATGR
ncbi:dihydrofolate reductase [Natronocella acetinitrilica]|uniref:Dihydrofolate reductase n=1 Tax=Natronocella acetinitrilica TaxID=414046 RepID=A0AAE3KGC7_9GAMM|nr:dihydrofolate reductase [Natronocella acetinitrilica]MCP1675112.1 dihydrofolate reductase [Natronocella acetinitrilica]